jgi:beta-glucosidase
VAVGSSWDPEVAARIGAAIGREARAAGVSVVLGPGVNIKRSPLCGRNFEYYSEDPLLSGVLATAYVRAMQAEGAGASLKHFAANNQETDRMRISVDVDERTLREIYLPAFERVVTEAQPATVMCSYNRINGVYASQAPRTSSTKCGAPAIRAGPVTGTRDRAHVSPTRPESVESIRSATIID